MPGLPLDYPCEYQSATGYIITIFTAIVGGTVYLGIGQLIVGMIQNPETVNSTSRLIYFIFILVGMVGEFGALGDQMKKISLWSPYGTVKNIISTGIVPIKWNNHTTMALLATIGYAAIFSVIGIKKFKWNNK